MSQPPSSQGWPGQPSVAPPPPAPSGTSHPLLWARMPSDFAAPATPRSAEEALAMMERSHAATVALLDDAERTGDDDETTPLTPAWFASVREACARSGRVPGTERLLFEWWIDEPPVEGLAQLPWLFGVWQGHWICWAGTTPWAAADLTARSTYDDAAVRTAVQFGADPANPPVTPWPPFGTSDLAVPTAILVALSGRPAPAERVIPETPLYVAPAPPPAPAPLTEPIPSDESASLEESVNPGADVATTLPSDATAVAPVAPIEPAAPVAAELPPAGWHPDPSGRHALRYWDGTGWTAHAADPGTATLHDPI